MEVNPRGTCESGRTTDHPWVGASHAVAKIVRTARVYIKGQHVDQGVTYPQGKCKEICRKNKGGTQKNQGETQTQAPEGKGKHTHAHTHATNRRGEEYQGGHTHQDRVNLVKRV